MSNDVVALRVDGLAKRFTVGSMTRRRVIHAVRNVSLSIDHGEVVAVVGESGSGKSTLIRLLALLEARTSGEIFLGGEFVPAKLSFHSIKLYRQQVQVIFQDPFAALNPYYPVGHSLAQPLNNLTAERNISHALEDVLHKVGLTPPRQFLEKYPHELSGGQRQRIGIARALVVKPRILLADEPTSMLDVSIRAGILNLLERLKEGEGLGILFVTHDLASARYLSDRVVVMYGGEIMEEGSTEEVVGNPAHPYTRVLLAAVPDPYKAHLMNVEVSGEVPELLSLSSGCPFQPRCKFALDECSTVRPSLRTIASDHFAACHLYDVSASRDTVEHAQSAHEVHTQ